jgi:hypothetical protein
MNSNRLLTERPLSEQKNRSPGKYIPRERKPIRLIKVNDSISMT